MADTVGIAPPHRHQDLVEEIDCALTRAKRLLGRAESQDEKWFLEMACAKLFEAFAWAENAAYAPKEDS